MNKLILLIDDDPVVNLINSRLIKKNSDLLVDSCTNAFEKLQQLVIQISTGHTELPDMILLDINMPIMDGWEFLDEFQKHYKNLKDKCKVYILTSSIDLDDIEKSKNYSLVKGFLSKPLTHEVIKSTLI